MKIAITSVYANPIHPGHIECFELSRSLADQLWVIVNNDTQAKLKRGSESFQDENYRKRVVESSQYVDKVILSSDTDTTVCQTLTKLIKKAQSDPDITEIIFTKGGDRFADEIPERKICEKYGVKIVDGLGKKTYHSSWYVNRLGNNTDATVLKKTLRELPDEVKEIDYLEVGYRPWGVYYVLEDKPSYKVKKIIVKPGQRLSLQSHQHRSEHWVEDPSYVGHQILHPNQSCYIPQGHIHRLSNLDESEILVLIEVQTGSYTGEDDITRYEDDYDRTEKMVVSTTVS